MNVLAWQNDDTAASEFRDQDGVAYVWRVTPHPDGGYTLDDSDWPIRPTDSRFSERAAAREAADDAERAFRVVEAYLNSEKA